MQNRPKFSISMATCERAYIIPKTIETVINQFYTNWELLIVDDGSKDNTKEVVESFNDERIKYIKIPIRGERYRAFQKGIDEATGDWVTIMGSDNFLSPFYLYYFKEYIKKFPEYNLFHCGAIELDRMGNRVRPPFGFKETEEGFEHFDSGRIGGGEFIWKKELMTEDIRLPDTSSPWEAATLANIPGYGNKIKPLGDPFGEDFWLFYKMTRKNKSKVVPAHLSFVWHDIEGWFKELNI